MESKKKKKENGSDEPKVRIGIKTQTERMELSTRGKVSWDEVRE